MSQPAETSLAHLPPFSDTPSPLARATTSPFLSKIPWIGTWATLLSVSAFAASLLTIAAHGKRGFFIPTLAIATCVLAGLFDAWTRRIPNKLTYTAILVGLLVNIFAWLLAFGHAETATRWLASPGIVQSLLGFSVCAIGGLIGVAFANVGGGDIKLLAALGAILGLVNVGYVLMIALAVAVVYSLLNLAVVGRLNALLRILALRALELFYLRRFEKITDDANPPSSAMIPMAIPLALGLIIAQVIDLQAWFAGGHS